MTEQKRVSTTVPLNWKEVWFTNCPMISANNVDQELGWCREEFKKIDTDRVVWKKAQQKACAPEDIENQDYAFPTSASC